MPTPLAERGAATSNTCCDTTFTLRAWSPRTVIRWESAPVRVATAVICLLSSGGWPNSLVRQDQMDVCPLARGVMLPLGRNSYPLHYRVAFASSILPCPHACRLPLRCAFPCGRRTGLPCSVSVTTNGVGALCPPVAWDAHDKETESPCTRYSALLAQAWQHLWLVFCDDVYRAFTWVRHAIHPSPVSVSVLTDTSSPHGCDASLTTVGSLSEGSVQIVTLLHIFVGYR